MDQANENKAADTPADDATPKRYQHPFATRVVPRQYDHLGRPFWESYLTPISFEVRAEAQVMPHLPGVVIFVHGVNSEGEWYDAAEKALCEGLNDRLNLSGETHLAANEYKDYDKDKKSSIPRQLRRRGRSPVIRFYWGYRAKDGEEKNWRVALRNLNGADIWKSDPKREQGPWYWGGGPFQNGTNNIQQLWSDKGFKRHVFGFDMQKFNTESDRHLQDAPPRDYYSHAAKRLADLIDEIRRHSPRDTITIMSHSQGTMIALAATTLCVTRAPDALFVMNSPFALDDKVTDALTCGAERPTPEARVNTFRHIAERIKHDKFTFDDDSMEQLHVGATEDLNFWRPNVRVRDFPERDNHGRMYVYFTPHDRVMGTTPLQSIGWQGIDTKLLDELDDTVKQRMLARVTPVGDEPGMKPFGKLPPIQDPVEGVQPYEFWNGNRGPVFGLMKLWEVPPLDQMVRINAEAVPKPLTAEDMRGFEESRKGAFKLGDIDPKTGRHREPSYPYLASTAEPERMLERPADPYTPGRVFSRETREEMMDFLNNYRPEPTNHSTVPDNIEFMKRVVAYDLPIGFCDAYEDVGFWNKLMKRADWTQGFDVYFETGTFEPVARPSSIDWKTISEQVSEMDVQKQENKQYSGA
jgi:pimeloyl-ACP methyl ester carboxylesterase